MIIPQIITRHVPWQKIKVQDPQGPVSIHFNPGFPRSRVIHFRIGPASSIHFRILGSCEVYISGSWVSKVPRPVYVSGSRVSKVPRQVYISRSWVTRSHDKYKFRDPESPRSHNLEFQDPRSPISHDKWYALGYSVPKVP